MDKINNNCRTCLNASKGLQSLSKAATDENKQSKSYAELLNEVAKINIMNDKCLKLPQYICGCCSRKLKAAHAFIQQAQEVNEKLCTMLLSCDGNKQLDCLQETQIDMESCFKIKMEYDEVENNVDELLNENVPLKKEEIEEDTLNANVVQSDGFEQRHCVRDSFDMIFYKTSTQIADARDNVQNIPLQNLDTFDNILGESSSIDDNAHQEERKIVNNKRSKNKLSLSSKSEISKKIVHSESPNSESNERLKKSITNREDELLPARCNDCDKVFPNARHLNRHRRGTHMPDDLKIQCLHCDAKFSRRHNMYAHIRSIHKMEFLEEHQLQPKKVNKQHACKECPRSYANKYKLIAHVNTHHSLEGTPNASSEKVLQPKKRFLCALCGLTFNSQSNLNIHFRRHTGEKPYKCEFCDRAYHRLCDVQVHRRSHTGEKPYQCTLCEKAFRRPSKLKIHMRTHTNERPYKCMQCEKAFKQSKDLNIHKRTHTGERPYKCSVCQSTFTQSNSLRLHQTKQKHFETNNSPEDLSAEITYLSHQT